METLPADLKKALASDPKAKTQWQALTPISRRDFISWIESAKQAETRTRRVAVAIDKLASGKRRPCCYAIVPMNLYKALAGTPKAKTAWKGLSPDARRDFVGWIEKAKDADEKGERIAKACVLLAAGNPAPRT